MTYTYSSFLEPYIMPFLEKQKASFSQSTYDHSCGILQHFDKYVISHNISDINFTEPQILQWISTIKRKKSTVNSYIGIIRAFFTFMNANGIHPFMPLYQKDDDDYLAYEFSDDEINRIFSLADDFVISPSAKVKYVYRHYGLPMLLRLLFGCGLRLEEASTLKLGDFDIPKGSLRIRKTKSREYRLVPMDQSLTDMLVEYCIAIGVGVDPESYIFPGDDFSSPIPSYCFRYYFNSILEEAGILLPDRKKYERGPCLHCMRHAFSHRSFKKGASEGWAVYDQIPWLSIYLGHKNLQETERYLRFRSEMFSEEIEPFEAYSAELFPEVNYGE